MNYIYIHKEKISVITYVMHEKFDEIKICKSKGKLTELYGFSFDERHIDIELAEDTICVEFNYDNKTHHLYLGYNTPSKIMKLIKIRRTLLFNLHYIDSFDINMFNKRIRDIHNFRCSSIQACFSFWDIDLNFKGMLFEADLEFYGAYFLRSVNFYKCEFKGNLYCRYTKFLDSVNFYCSIFYGVAIFNYFTFKNLSFEKAIFKDKLFFSNMNFLLSTKEKKTVKLKIYDSEIVELDISFNEELIKSITNKEYECHEKLKKKEMEKIISSEFQLLNKIFRSRNYYTEEDASFLLYRKYKMKSYPLNIKKCIEYIYYIIGGYGTKLSWIIMSCVLVIIFFIFIYFALYTEIKGFNQSTINESIALSMQAFFSFSYIIIDNEMLSFLFPIICLESIFGHVLIIYFTICFSRKAAR